MSGDGVGNSNHCLVQHTVFITVDVRIGDSVR